MKIPIVFLISLILFSCKSEEEKIVFEFPKDIKMKFEDFNEGMEEYTSPIIYVGDFKDTLDVKYYRSDCNIPPPPKFNENMKEYEKKIKKSQDSLNHIFENYIHFNSLKTIEIPSNKNLVLSNHNISIKIIKDTIPIFRRNLSEIKSYKGFPVIIKNISQKTITIPVDSFIISLYFKNKQNKWQSVRNSNYMFGGCIPLPYMDCVQLKPKQMLIYAVPYFKKGKDFEIKSRFGDAVSEPISLSIDPEIINKQRESIYLK